MAKRSEFKETTAATSPQGNKIKFPEPLAAGEMRDFERARQLNDAKEAEDQRIEDLDNERRNQQLKKLQQDNYNDLVTKQTQRPKEKRDEQIRGAAYYGSVRIPDMVDPHEPEDVKKEKI